MIKIQSPDKIIIHSEKKRDIMIYIDLDGVTASWKKSLLRVVGVDYEDEETRTYLKKNNGKIDGMADVDLMWKEIKKEGTKFWAELDLFPWSKELWDKMNKKSNNVYFLTTPSEEPESCAGKHEWIKKHFDTRKFVIAPEKQVCANSNAILIDDFPENIEAFEEAGGHGFLWPNDLAIEDGEEIIEDVFDKLIKKIDSIK